MKFVKIRKIYQKIHRKNVSQNDKRTSQNSLAYLAAL